MSENSTFPGITPPLSLSESSQADKEATISLEKTLREYNMYESPERTQLRERVLETLDKMTKAFVYSVSTRDGMTEAQAERSGGKVLTYGSYRLGVHGRDSDIDTLCIFPSHVRRTDFFTTMLHLLRSDENIKDITAVQDSYVPVIKFKFSGISIDLVCARLSVSQVPDDIELTGTDFLSRLEEKCIRSINGTRVADDILHLVPNTATFRTALRCIKLWATKKAIYSNVLGFLGGVAWAILTARVCQLFPNASASTVVYKFFRIMHAWDWAKSPVKLRMDEEGPPLPHVSSWNPRYNPADKLHRMPIITPTYPHMCTTHNVSASTLRILKGEFRMAAETMNKIIVMGAPWSVLFERRQFFEMYDYYLQIVVSSDAYDHLRTWSGFIEAKLRLLLIKLEGISDIAMVHPYVHSFTRETPCFNRQDMEAALSAQPLSPMDGVEPIGTVWTKTFYFGLYIRAGPGGSVDISWPVHEFKNMVKGTQVFDATHMGITTHMLTKDYLPDEVFAEPQDEEIEENDIVTQQQDDSDMELEEEEDEVEEQEVSSSGHKRTSQSPQEGSEPKRSKTVIRSQSIIMPQTATTST